MATALQCVVLPGSVQQISALRAPVRSSHICSAVTFSRKSNSSIVPAGHSHGSMSHSLSGTPLVLQVYRKNESQLTQDPQRRLTPVCSSATNICWQDPCVSKEQRHTLLSQKGCVIWFTGLSGSGKSTVAFMVDQLLTSMGKLCYVLDGDNLRHGLNKNLGFSAADRQENIRRVGEVAKLFADLGTITIVSLISPYRQDRDRVRNIVREGEFIEVFMNVPLDICERRDCKGLYKLARAGKITGFTGIDDPYEQPLNPEISLNATDHGSCVAPDEMARSVIRYLTDCGFLTG